MVVRGIVDVRVALLAAVVEAAKDESDEEGNDEDENEEARKLEDEKEDNEKADDDECAIAFNAVYTIRFISSVRYGAISPIRTQREVGGHGAGLFQASSHASASR